MLCDPDDYGVAEVYDAQTRRAKKAHECCECGGPILPGQTYERVFIVYDKSAKGFATCADCRSAWGVFGCAARPHGQLMSLATGVGDDKIVGMLNAIRKARDAAFAAMGNPQESA